jgi:surfeit locus 1 family protein
MLSSYFGRKNILKTLFILAAAAVCIWLGFWQLDRLKWRRDLNAATRAQLDQPPLDLNDVTDEAALRDMTDRAITATGQFDFNEQIVLLNQNSQEVGFGVHLVAPFILTGTNRAVLVDRGWISSAEWQSADLRQFDEPLTRLTGVVQPFSPRTATLANDETFLLNFEQMQAVISAELLPIVFLQTADEVDLTARPYRTAYDVVLSEGSHLSYAVQWFSFATIFVVGYIFYIRKYG